MRYRTLPVLFLLIAAVIQAQQFDIVISRGRVIDPETGLDGVRDVAILDGHIAAISEQPLEGRTVIPAAGLVVSPGFIDLHQHGQTEENYEFKARDGVTTALELEVGVSPVNEWYRQREGKSLINFGASVGHIPVRIKVFGDSGTFLPRDRAVNAVANAGQLHEILAALQTGLDQGALGIGFGIAYVPGASRGEIFQIFKLAASRKVPVFVHLRSAGPVDPGGIDALQEVLADAASTGASLHVVHITSTELTDTPLALSMIHGAAAHGEDVTTEAYPYTAGMTDLSSAIFSPGWQERNGGIGFHDLQWAATGERLTAESFARYRREGGMVAIHSIPEQVVRTAMADPEVMIASDGILDHGKGHPRAAGTFARVLGVYVREQHVLTLMDAIRKMSLMPANRLGLARKGRMQVGADADITVFDPNHVIDRATFEKPAQYSDGIPYVLVNGTIVVKDGTLQTDVYPGKGLRRP
ncbi:MAG: amidohydrolase family protein [Bryobacteraceae bacterium]